MVWYHSVDGWMGEEYYTEIHSWIERKVMMWENVKVLVSCFETNFAYHLYLSAFLSLSVLCSSICSSVHLCTASLHGSVTCMCHCWTDCMSTTPLNTPVASSCARTTAPMKLSSSKCEPSPHWPCVKTVGGETEKVEERWYTRERERGWVDTVDREESGVIKAMLRSTIVQWKTN